MTLHPRSRVAPLMSRSTRRAFLRHSALGGVGLAILAACGSPSSGESSTPESAAPTPSPPPVADSAPVASSSAPVSPVSDSSSVSEAIPPSEVPAESTAAPAGGTFGSVAELSVSFTYVPTDDGGRVHNPYIAVWIEDTDGNSIRTLNVTYEQGRKGQKWLRDLRRWFSADEARIAAGGTAIIDTVSSPTRLPGTTDLVWDGTNDVGELVASGTYVLIIEAARERGPYDVITQELTLSGEPFEQELDAVGDLQQAKVSVRAV